MYHPQPQHPLSTHRHFHTEFLEHYPSSCDTSNTWDSQPLPSEGLYQLQENVELRQYAMSVHPPMPPTLEPQTPETYHGFEVSATRFPLKSPTFALRPVTAPFSHIEYPNLSPARSQQSDGYESERYEPVATAHNHMHSRESSYSDQQPAYEGTSLGFAYFKPHKPQDLRTQSYQTSSERSQQEGHGFNEAAQPIECLGTLRPPARRRVRGDSNSSAASVWSSPAVAGDATYPNEVLPDDANLNSSYSNPNLPNDQFQPRSAPTTYSYGASPIPNGSRYAGPTNTTLHDTFPHSPAAVMDIDPPFVAPPAPGPNEIELRDPDHPFTYQGAHWDVSNGAFSVASTDCDATSLHSQGGPSSRDSSEPTRDNRRGRRVGTTGSPAAPEQRKTSGEGRKKTSASFVAMEAIHALTVSNVRKNARTMLLFAGGVLGGGTSPHKRPRGYSSLTDTARGTVAQTETKQRAQGRTTRSKTAKDETRKDAWSQTSPPTNQLPAAFSNGGAMAFYPPDARSQVHFPTPEDSPTGGQEYQAISTPFDHLREQEPVALRSAREEAQQTAFMRQYQTEGHRRAVSGHLAPGLQTPVSQESSSYYDGSPDRTSSQQQYYPPSAAAYASNRYSIATTLGGDSAYSHTDSESAYAYSEGANVLPYGHGYQQPRQVGASQHPREADGDDTMMNAYSDIRTRVEGYGARR
ncbi:unnamed protein product [Rhizoctonia solani]|uniref:Uncharacterized protein n=1 Tax=Rhizoctonia solani TaxID=456999 RepID=A0A8H3C5J0_9AGAM|nr:unnamed protein product [Rhizoctonia solani]